MSTIQHTVVAVTTWNLEIVDDLRLLVGMTFPPSMVSPPLRSPVNAFTTIFVAPSGSKVGWAEQREHDARIATLLDGLKRFEYEDGSSPVVCTVVSYGELGEHFVSHDPTEVSA